MYKYSSFTDLKNKKKIYPQILKETATIAGSASVYSRGRNFDVRHLDNFISSKVKPRVIETNYSIGRRPPSVEQIDDIVNLQTFDARLKPRKSTKK